MQVKLYASFRQAAGVKMIEVEPRPGLTVREVLHEVTRRHPVLKVIFWKENGELSELVHVFINGENMSHLERLDTALTATDKVDIFPPLAGGQVI